MPESFKVLIKELQSLCLDVKVLGDNTGEIQLKESDEDTVELGVNIEGNEESEVDERTKRPSFMEDDFDFEDDDMDLNLDDIDIEEEEEIVNEDDYEVISIDELEEPDFADEPDEEDLLDLDISDEDLLASDMDADLLGDFDLGFDTHND